MEVDNESKPFYTVYHKCDDVFNPQPPPLINLIVCKLIQRKLPHMVVQNTHRPSNDLLSTMSAYVYYTDDSKLICCKRADEWVDDEKLTILCIENFDDSLPHSNPNLFWSVLQE